MKELINNLMSQYYIYSTDYISIAVGIYLAAIDLFYDRVSENDSLKDIIIGNMKSRVNNNAVEETIQIVKSNYSKTLNLGKKVERNEKEEEITQLNKNYSTKSTFQYLSNLTICSLDLEDFDYKIRPKSSKNIKYYADTFFNQEPRMFRNSRTEVIIFSSGGI
jgi:hypothetical protein